MLLTVTSTAPSATDLGFLLHKHPDRVQSFDLPVGTAHVFYPDATDDRCTVALLLEVDPIGLVRGKRFSGSDFALSQYVNDRPYAASSLLAVALGKVFSTAMKGRCAARPDLEGCDLPLTIHLPAVPTGGDTELVERLFAPLGWSVDARVGELDPHQQAWGQAPYVDLTLTGEQTLAAALTHLYVLLPVLDQSKHYWVGQDEVDKLMRAAGDWLPAHPERDLITRRYLAHQRSYVEDATARLASLDDSVDAAPEDEAPKPSPLKEIRALAVLAELSAIKASRVVDMGCGGGALLRRLLDDPRFTEVVGADVSARELDRAGRRLNLDRMPDSQRARLTLVQSSATYRDERLTGYDAVVLMEVIEHIDLPRLPALVRSVFVHARPKAVLVTTPNVEFNVRYASLPAGDRRHPDHRFEWTRTEFEEWADAVATAHGYAVRFRPVGDVDPEVGSPTQMAVFTRNHEEVSG